MSQETVVIRPTSGWRAIDLRELWRFRELVYFLALRDVKLRYRQTVLGVAWALLQPLLAMAIFTVFLGRLAGVPSDGVPYALFAFVGLVPWMYFANSVVAAGNSVVSNSQLVTKVYFPRLLIPLSSVLPGLVDLALATGLALVMLVVSGRTPSLQLLATPLFALLAAATALAVGVWSAALNVQYRDVRHALPFVVQIWLFATPVVYPASLAPADVRPLLGLNPMAGVVEGFRWSLLGTGDGLGLLLSLSISVTLVVLATGLLYFRRVERRFADVI